MVSTDTPSASPPIPKVIRIVVPVIILFIAGVVSIFLIVTAPTAQPEDVTPAPLSVQAVPLERSDSPITVTAYGTVIPAREVTIRPEVTGRVLRQHPSLVPGGVIAEGEELIGIDDTDYQLILNEQTAAFEDASYEQEIEKGRQVVAEREWEQLKGEFESLDANASLVLREPHLRRTEALIASARNEIEKAKVDIERTSVKAPFNSVVLEENVDLGQLVTPGDTVARLAGTDEFWVQASLPVEDLPKIRLPEGGGKGAAVQVTMNAGASASFVWDGYVTRLLSDLAPSSREAQVLISVPNPTEIAPGGLPLLLGSYVRVDIDAGTLNDVFEITRKGLREDDQIWIVDTSNQLRIADAEVVWKVDESVFIEAEIEPGELLITDGIRTPLPGTTVEPQVRTALTSQEPHQAAIPR